ncbi:hypothetical protein [Flavobacterium litorale]|uniref:Uncharacterized protein n=1 Tax=Flavobacterium litorale TaxID=2856519 RepID=A0ABX8V4I6_9FLAO|nr:hypothetical protein [Flavobacterium litorale]QYJ67700.1 hypothetical protein K1I41_09105 [Flavobacterium litorale]
MYKKNLLIYIALLFCGCGNGFSQSLTTESTTTKTDSIYNAKYKEFYEKFLNYYCSEPNLKMRRLSYEFKKKMNYNGNDFDIMLRGLTWVKENIDRTEFSSIEEAESEWQAYIDAKMIDWKENYEYHKYYGEFIMKHIDVFKDVVKDVRANHQRTTNPWLFE